MGKDIYKKLARFLDNLPGGFPPTDSGVEIRILRRLFTPREAEMALRLPLIPEEADSIARKIKWDTQEVSQLLNEMARKGLIFSLERDGRPPKYMATQFVIGIWEYHVNKLEPELIKDFNEYVPTLFNLETWKKAPQLRTVPVGRSLETRLEVLPYEDAEELVKKQKRFLEAPCICRQEHRIVGEGCDKPGGNCLVFGPAVEYFKKNDTGREITREEALELLKKADKAGLVLQPSFSKKISNVCCCCGCCCQVLRNVKSHPRPAEYVHSSFQANLDRSRCSGCGVCVDRCQMEALSMEEEKAVIAIHRCIGCGLCVSACPTDALSLERKPEPPPEVPEDMIKAAVLRAKIRGKLSPLRRLKVAITLFKRRRNLRGL